MTNEVNTITDEQIQELSDAIADKCEAMNLEPTQILDGLSRTLLSAAMVFDTRDFSISIEKVGTVEVKQLVSTAS